MAQYLSDSRDVAGKLTLNLVRELVRRAFFFFFLLSEGALKLVTCFVTILPVELGAVLFCLLSDGDFRAEFTWLLASQR